MAQQTLICIGCQYSRVSTLLAAGDVCDSASLRSKRFCLVSEQRETSVLAAREMKREPKNERGGRGRRKEGLISSPSPPRSFSCDTFRAVCYSRSSFFARKPHGNACYAGYDSAPKIPFCWRTFVRNLANERWLVDARNIPGDEVRGQTAVFAGFDLWGRISDLFKANPCKLQRVRVDGRKWLKNDTIRVDTIFFGNNKREKFPYAIKKNGIFVNGPETS